MSYPIVKNLEGRRAAVIGSDLAGLAAAVSLAVRGARVVVLEEAATAMPSFVSRSLGDYRFGYTPAMIVGPGILAELFASADYRLTDFVSLERPRPLVRFLLPGGDPLDLGEEPRTFLERLATLDPGCRTAVGKLLARSERLHEAAEEWRKAETEGGPRMPLCRLKCLADYYDFRSSLGAVNRTLRNPALRSVFLSLGAATGLSPRRTPVAGLHQWAAVMTHGGWQIAGGVEAFREGLLRLCRELQIRIIRKTRIDEIETVGGRVRRIVGQGFQPLAVSIVVSTRDASSTLRQYLPKADLPRTEIIRRLTPEPPLSRLVVRLGLNKRWPALRRVNLLPSELPEEESRFMERWLVPPTQPTILAEQTGSAPEDHSVLTLTMRQPPASHRFVWTDARQEEYLERVFGILESRGLDGIRDAIVEQEVTLPDKADEEKHPLHRTSWKPLRPGFRPGSCRVAEVPGLYLARPMALDPDGLAADAHAGIQAALLVSADAGSV